MRPAPRRPRLLLGDPALDDGLVARLESEGFEVELEADPERVPERLRSEPWDVALCEPGAGQDPPDPLGAALQNPSPPAVILLDGFGTIDEAVAAVRRGAFDYIAKPASDEQVLVSVRRALEQRSLVAENRALREDLGQRYRLSNLISRDPRMQRVFQTVRSIADTRASVLIEGESGTGKTMLARAIHLNSSRAAGPLVVVDCGAIPAALLESELFGHVRGAFTGAVRDREGKFEAAHGGTVFLDEVANAPLDLQVKLLRVLQSRSFERVGDTETREVDVRIVAAGNRPLLEEVAAGRFREDLYYRLNVVAIEVPPLRERPADVALLADTFLVRFREEHEREVEGFTRDALRRLAAHAWPGNVRELENRVERSVLLAAGPWIEAADLGLLDAVAGSEPGGDAGGGGASELRPGPLKKALEGPERRIIELALAACGGNRQETARLLEINRTTLFNKMRKYGLLDVPARRP